MSRTYAESPLWQALYASEKFRQRTWTEYSINGFQIGAYLSVPGVVGPQVGRIVTIANFKNRSAKFD